MTGTGPEDIAAEVERQREKLADTVDALHAKLDVRSHARHRVEQIRDRWTTETGKPRTPVLMAGAAAIALVFGLVVWRWRR
jgi:hypothetical protein